MTVDCVYFIMVLLSWPGHSRKKKEMLSSMNFYLVK